MRLVATQLLLLTTQISWIWNILCYEGVLELLSSILALYNKTKEVILREVT